MEKKENFLKRHWLVMLCGLLVGAAAVVLALELLSALKQPSAAEGGEVRA